MRQVFHVIDVLREGDDVLVEGWNAAAELSRVAQIAHRDLHVIQRDEHGLHDRRVEREIHPLLIRCADVYAEERIPIVARRKCCDALQQRFIRNLFQTLVAATAYSAMQSSVARALLTGHDVPFVHLDVAVLQTLELELRTVLRVPSREALVAGLAMKRTMLLSTFCASSMRRSSFSRKAVWIFAVRTGVWSEPQMVTRCGSEARAVSSAA